MAERRFRDEWLLAAAAALPGWNRDAVEALRGKLDFAADALIECGVSPQALEKAVAATGQELSTDNAPERLAVSLIPEKVCRRWRLLPLAVKGEAIEVAMADPKDPDALADVQSLAGRPVRALYCLPSRLETMITEAYNPDIIVYDILRRVEGGEHVELVEGLRHDAVEEASEVRAPVMRLANAILAKAVESGASDIHLEHEERQSLVRYRIDGTLRTVMSLPRYIGSGPLVSRIKIMADLDIADRRRPQDGRAKIRVGGAELGLRVSTLPSQFGETTVIRILDPRSARAAFDALGAHPETVAKLERLVRSPQGMLLVTGPTGSGKTTTLYWLLGKLKTGDTKIITAEDPVEYRLDGVNQVQVREKHGLGFAAVLRSALRQDPDVIMVGEIRDKETAEVAFQAALTGHLVLSTVHANDAVATVTRLADMGVERFKIGPALLALTAQRLVRRLCTDCRGAGCVGCGATGFRGRVALVELLELTPAIREAIAAGADEEALRRAARESGCYRALAEDARWLLEEGLTTEAEVLPYLDAPPPRKAPTPPQAPAAVPASGGKRVLLCDDDATVRAVVRKALQAEGFAVSEAVDGAQGLAKVVSEPPDLLIVDLQMPNLDGRQLIGALRSGVARSLPVIVLTSLDDEHSQETVLNLGADDFVGKPVKPGALAARVKALFRRLEA